MTPERLADARLRLFAMREQAEAVGVDMIAEAGRFGAIAGAEPTRAISAWQLFQTPEAVAAGMAATLAALVPDGATWLEPSAGLGRLYRAGRRGGLGGPCTLVELVPDCLRELYEATAGDGDARLRAGDFLAMDFGGQRFGAILMNPPFQRGADVRHILRARELLALGGALVALCYDGTVQRARLQPLAEQWAPLPAGAFRSEGTRAAVVRLVIRAGAA